jgi:hypothetical protein
VKLLASSSDDVREQVYFTYLNIPSFIFSMQILSETEKIIRIF